ncbi:MAG TPA: hypothetical protein VFH38_00200 [Jatrophihabitans sp.]|nr:hypothetical protein [Jatrophihabitans sp.]
MIYNPVPRVCLYPDRQVPELSARIVAAGRMLADAGRVKLVEPGETADLAHAVGDAPTYGPAPVRLRTVAAVPLRAGRLTAAPGWVRRQRRAGADVVWLAHGQTAARLLLDAGIAPAGRLHCLPLLAPPIGTLSPSRAVERAAVRDGLGLRPGERLVIGTEGGSDTGDEPGWVRELREIKRSDAVVLRMRPADRVHGAYRVHAERVGWLPEPLPLSALLAGCDVFVAADAQPTACTPAAAAADWGIPVVARATDAASDLVLAGGRGTVVPAGAWRVARAVADQLDGGIFNHAGTAPPDPGRRDAELARALLAVYRRTVRRTIAAGAA